VSLIYSAWQVAGLLVAGLICWWAVDRSRLLAWRSRLFELSSGSRGHLWHWAILQDWILEQSISNVVRPCRYLQ